jgi:hypothetical protein
MNKKAVTNLSPQNPYQDAYKLACDALRNADIKERSEKSGAALEADKSGYVVTLTFLNKLYQIRFPDIDVTYHALDQEVSIWSKILILHYIINSQGCPLTGEWIDFRQVPGGSNYYPAFVKRSQKPLRDFFGNQLDLLEEAARNLGGERADYGDRAVIIPALPRVPIALVFWVGDEEFPPEANILFDSTISAYLSTEDIAVLSQQIVFAMIKWAKNNSDK